VVLYPRRNTTVLPEDASVFDVAFVFLPVLVFGFMCLVWCVFVCFLLDECKSSSFVLCAEYIPN